jgi:hypothetical protein
MLGNKQIKITPNKLAEGSLIRIVQNDVRIKNNINIATRLIA